VSIDLDFDAGQQALAQAVSQFCRDHWTEEDARAPGPGFSRARWRALADLGVLAAGAPGEESGALEICAVVEALGHAAFPGPLVASYLAQQVLPADEAARIAAGEAVVCVGTPPLLAWAEQADCFLECDAGRLYRAQPAAAVKPVAGFGGEAWGRVGLVRGDALPESTRGLALGEIVRAAYLAAAGGRLIADATEHARSRRQFGHPIGEFQAVAHPLAQAHMRLEAARTLARAAACAFDGAPPAEAASRAGLAGLSATGAALDAVHVGHQIFGALGITLEGPAFPLSRRIRSLAGQGPGADRAREELCSELGWAG
jgi:alkylation response protein AidB-like acyl-CoA dehydrogenase